LPKFRQTQKHDGDGDLHHCCAPTSLHLPLHTTPMVFLLLLFVEASTRTSKSNGNESGGGSFVVVVIIVGSLGLPINVSERGDK